MNGTDKYDEMAQSLLRSLRYISSRGIGERQLSEHHIAGFLPTVAAALRKQGEEIERLQYELCVIGDMAVVDWDDAVVGKVDTIVPGQSKTYNDARRAELAQYETMKAQLADGEKRGMERAISIAQSWRDDGSRPWIGEQIADAIRAEIEKGKP